MIDHYGMLKALIKAGRDEGFMDEGDNISQANEVLIIFSGFESIESEYEDQDTEDTNSEIYEIYINAKALDEGFTYAEHHELMGIEFGHKNEIHIRAVYEVDKDSLHTNILEEYVEMARDISVDEVKKVIEAAHNNYFD
jgi:hypothetical protein